jgi:hypothetical protein
MKQISEFYKIIITPKPVLRFAVIALVVVGCLLLIPLAAMQFSTDVDWSVFDFILAFILLFGSAMLYKLVSQSAALIIPAMQDAEFSIEGLSLFFALHGFCTSLWIISALLFRYSALKKA